MNAPTPDLTLQVVGREDVGDTVVLELAAADGGALPGWQPGAHVDLVLPDGLVRQYSLCGGPDQGPLEAPTTWRLAVLREAESRGGSSWLAEHAVPGTTLAAAGPRTHFALERGEGPVLLLAAGIGLTPLLPMADAALAAGREYALHVVGREGRLPFLDELAARHGEHLVVHLTDGPGGRPDLAALVEAAPRAVVHACGPAGFLESVEAACTAAGSHLRVEHFVPEEQGDVVWDGAFEVEFALSGVTATVGPDQGILDVAEENGIFVLTSCQEGTCGTCETVVLEGDVDHRDSILTPAEREHGDRMYVCVSRAACPKIKVEL
ncbi:PDR/VanB family oxidoreductase [Nocardioides sp. GY 10127]|uniref:PDR/VanB family oxidoreductase n=1 Tax=Nocardioides sp. GY 10127 TaxID=2569762 RepID=UPI0010A83F6A|nr:PDR/VanB family oxidoreductase [Nocardioides sp. GY 10127]TIC81929.1 oxidoreductase [Nocardioides sp. GY 10127]